MQNIEIIKSDSPFRKKGIIQMCIVLPLGKLQSLPTNPLFIHEHSPLCTLQVPPFLLITLNQD